MKKPLYLLSAMGLLAWVLARYVWLGRGKLPQDAQVRELALGDGERISYWHVDRGRKSVVILSHGLLKRKDDHKLLGLADILLPHWDLIAYDQPGHGQSTGVAPLDWSRAGRCFSELVAEARHLGYAHVLGVGVSLGAAATIFAAAQGARLDGVVSLSCPAGPPWMPARTWRPGALRPIARLLGARLSARIDHGRWPIDVIGDRAACPLLIVHCGRDTIVPRAASEALLRSAGENATWLLDSTALHGAPRCSRDEIVLWIDRCIRQAEKTGG
ncbi:MAG: alpha/beta hydrolase [Chloroflexi bacterium]|nr:alpha/beta hydrolase [Chloroflexota bacterium]